MSFFSELILRSIFRTDDKQKGKNTVRDEAHDRKPKENPFQQGFIFYIGEIKRQYNKKGDGGNITQMSNVFHFLYLWILFSVGQGQKGSHDLFVFL